MIGFQIIEAIHSAQQHNDDVAFVRACVRAFVDACKRLLEFEKVALELM